MTLQNICNTYWKHIPLAEIFKVCKENGYTPIDDDGSEWEGILTGRTGRISIDLLNKKPKLNIQWYKMESGNYEINAYIF